MEGGKILTVSGEGRRIFKFRILMLTSLPASRTFLASLDSMWFEDRLSTTFVIHKWEKSIHPTIGGYHCVESRLNDMSMDHN